MYRHVHERKRARVIIHWDNGGRKLTARGQTPITDNGAGVITCREEAQTLESKCAAAPCYMMRMSAVFTLMTDTS